MSADESDTACFFCGHPTGDPFREWVDVEAVRYRCCTRCFEDGIAITRSHPPIEWFYRNNPDRAAWRVETKKETYSQVEPPKPLGEWLTIASEAVLSTIAQAETPIQLLELAIRLNELSAELEVFEKEMRAALALRRTEITGMTPGQG